MRFKLGLKPARPGAIKLKLSDYYKAAALPAVPQVIGQFDDWPASFGVYGNDDWGDCFWAGSAHETMVLNADAGRNVAFNDRCVLYDYADATGFKFTAASDQGTDLLDGCKYRQQTGIADTLSVRHKIGPYTSLRVGDLDELAIAVYLFGGAGIGVELPSTAMTQFNATEPWSVVPGVSTVGGHYIPIVGRNSAGLWVCVTWGRLQGITSAWLLHNMDQGVAFASQERLNAKNVSPQGFDWAALQADYQAVTA